MYNALQRGIEPELIAVCRRFGIDLVVYNPLAGGLFSGKLKTKDVPADGRFSDDGGVRGQLYRERYFKDATFDALRLIEPVVQKHSLTLVETAFRWLRHHSQLNLKHPGNDGIILGVSSQQQLETNLADLEKGPLPEEVVRVLDEAWLVAKSTAAHYWHGKLEYSYDTYKALLEEPQS